MITTLPLRNQKRAQVNMTETIAVLFIFFILVIFGIVFYSRYQAGSIKEQQQEFSQRNTIEITTRTLFLPELLCTKGKAEIDTFCFDVTKLNHIKDTTQPSDQLRDYYFQVFGYATIKVKELFPGDQEWTIYEKPKINPDTNTPSPNKEKTYFIVSLRDDITKRGSSRFGMVEVEVYP